MKTWDLFLPLVLPQCPGCSDLVAEEEIRNAAEDFLARAFVWRVWTGDVDTVDGQGEYAPPLPTASRMVKLHGAKLNGVVLSIEDDACGETGFPRQVYTPDLKLIGLEPVPRSAGMKLKVNLSLTITSSATGLADELFDAYRLWIAEGAVSRLASHEDRAYSSPSRSAESGARFETAIIEARSAKNRGNSGQRKRVVSQFM